MNLTVHAATVGNGVCIIAILTGKRYGLTSLLTRVWYTGYGLDIFV